MRPLRAAAVSALAMLLALPLTALPAVADDPAAAGPGGGYRLSYAVHVGGIHVMDAEAHLSLVRDSYRIGMRAATDGFLGRVADWRADITSHGRLDGAGLPRPQEYRALSVWRSKARNTVLEYEDGTPRLALVEPPPEEDREPVPEHLRPATVDPMTAIVAALESVAEGRGCGGAVPVYDGRQRYDLVFADRGRETLPANDISSFAGEAVACAIEFKPLAGRWKERQAQRRDRDDDARRARDTTPVFWVGRPVPEGPPVPVRLQASSPLGTVMIHLSGLERMGPGDTVGLPPL
ncbi:DUF3108 domain-containing protein [Rhodocista pekingensis]|uniref:DUF3108 domain-containing protein n=1 Tax=Rhodocista pekingensis TaxID=201185 RepID=A0ABW2KZL6_9PROT